MCCPGWCCDAVRLHCSWNNQAQLSSLFCHWQWCLGVQPGKQEEKVQKYKCRMAVTLTIAIACYHQGERSTPAISPPPPPPPTTEMIYICYRYAQWYQPTGLRSFCPNTGTSYSQVVTQQQHCFDSWTQPTSAAAIWHSVNVGIEQYTTLSHSASCWT